MSTEAGYAEIRRLADILVNFGITGPDHTALKDRESLGRYLVNCEPPDGPGATISIVDWREQRRALSHAGVEQLREAMRMCLTPAPAAVSFVPIDPRSPAAQSPTPTARTPTPPPPTPSPEAAAGPPEPGGETSPTDPEGETPPIVSASIHSPPGEWEI
jgi:hypothetical protein